MEVERVRDIREEERGMGGRETVEGEDDRNRIRVRRSRERE